MSWCVLASPQVCFCGSGGFFSGGHFCGLDARRSISEHHESLSVLVPQHPRPSTSGRVKQVFPKQRARKRKSLQFSFSQSCFIRNMKAQRRTNLTVYTHIYTLTSLFNPFSASDPVTHNLRPLYLFICHTVSKGGFCIFCIRAECWDWDSQLHLKYEQKYRKMWLRKSISIILVLELRQNSFLSFSWKIYFKRSNFIFNYLLNVELPV